MLNGPDCVLCVFTVFRLVQKYLDSDTFSLFFFIDAQLQESFMVLDNKTRTFHRFTASQMRGSDAFCCDKI